jgi:hypothetical protein
METREILLKADKVNVAGWARPRRQADRLFRHRRRRLVEAGYGPQA